MISERRIKILHIDCQLFHEVWNWWRKPNDYMALPITEDLPEDAVILSMHLSGERQCFSAIVHSASYAEVPVGELPPTIPDLMTEFRHVKMRKPITSFHETVVIDLMKQLQVGKEATVTIADKQYKITRCS